MGVSGYYLVGGNTYTMSLFHNMWNRQALENGLKEGHMQLLRNQLKDGKLFYLGHSAGLIMSGPNILPATFKGIDAFSIVTQSYNAPFLRLPPLENPETFFAKEKNDLLSARTKMLENMSRHGGWYGYRVVKQWHSRITMPARHSLRSHRVLKRTFVPRTNEGTSPSKKRRCLLESEGAKGPSLQRLRS